MHFHRRFLVTACRNVLFLLASSAGGAEKHQEKWVLSRLYSMRLYQWNTRNVTIKELQRTI